MAITDAKKVDYLWKKIGYGATKTDLNANKFAPNEAIASPLLLNGANTWNEASSIPGVQPASSTGVVTVHPTTNPIETTADATATANRTWKTDNIDWIPPEIGSTYQVKVYIHTSSDAGNAAASGDQVFATGSGNNDEWFFDYQSGVLHFIGNNLPNGIDFTGKSVYIAGARYTGEKGLQNLSSSGDANLTFVGDDSTGATLNSGTTLAFRGDNKIDITVDDDSTVGTARVNLNSVTTFTQDSAPANPEDGDRWFDSDTGAEFVYVVEGSSAHWVETGSAGTTLDADAVTSFRFAVDDSGSTTISQGETLSILGGDNITTDITGTGEIRISSTVSPVSTDDNSPSSPSDGDLWFETDTGELYLRLVEGSDAQWIEVGGGSAASTATAFTFSVVADDSQTIAVNNNGSIQFSGGTNITTSTSSEGVVTITGPDTSNFVSSGDNISTLTNDSGFITDITVSLSADDSQTIAVNNNGAIVFSGDENITTSTTSGGAVTFSLADDITINQISAKDSTDVSVTSPLQLTSTLQVAGEFTANGLAKLQTVKEGVTVAAVAATGTVQYDVSAQQILYYTTNASGDWTINITGPSDSSTDVNTLLDTGESITLTHAVTIGANEFRNTTVQVDGTTDNVTTRWLGGTPTVGHINSIDSYSYTVIKTAANTYTVLASLSQFTT